MQKSQRGQSAMEYLMTYGWAIAIIAVILYFLYSIGIFNLSSGSTAVGCVPATGYECSGLLMATNGLVFANIGSVQTISSTVETQCVIASNPTNSLGWSGAQGPIPPQGGVTITFLCPISSSVLGTSFSGTLWIQYTQAGIQRYAVVGAANVKSTEVAAAP